MKVWKKNLVAAAVLVTVCAGIYVNWLYTEQEEVASLSDTLDYEKVMSEDGLLLTEIAPGIDLKTQILDMMEFEPLIAPDLKVMDAALFAEAPIGLRALPEARE